MMLIENDMWMALASTLAISCAPVIILLLIPLHKDANTVYMSRLRLLLSFASGSLLGDTFLHLLPHAIMDATASHHGHDHDHHHHHHHDHHHDQDEHHHHDDHHEHAHHSHGHHGHDHSHSGPALVIGMWMLAGIYAFLMIEKLVRHVKGHGHSHGGRKKPNGRSVSGSKDKPARSSGQGDSAVRQRKSKPDSRPKSENATDVVRTTKPSGKIHVSGYLNLAADFAHNFTDGLAIGASYLAGQRIGLVTTLTIFLHEIPHEISDYALLVQAGCSKWKAISLQFTTAVGAFLGCLISLLAGGLDEHAVAWVLPFTAGGFIYIATVSILPELLEERSLVNSFMQLVALVFGVLFMYYIAVMEESSETLFSE